MKTTKEKVDEEVEEWNEYWGSKSLKRKAIEFFREKWFARVFVSLVKKYNKPKGKVLEAGCGSAVYAKQIGKVYYGCDLSREALKIASKTVPKERLKRGDLFSLPYRKDSFNLIFNQGVMEHFSDREFLEILSGFRKVAPKVLILVPSKYSVFRIWNPFEEVSPRFFSRRELARLLRRGGYKNVRTGYIKSSFLLTAYAYGERK